MKHALILTVLCVNAVFCRADAGLEGMSLKDVPAVAAVSPQPVVAASVPPSAPKEWTVIIYMNGNGVMPTGAYSDLDSMESVGSTQRVNVVVQLARNRGYAARHYVVKDGARGFNSPAVQTIPNADMGDYKTAADFISWAKANYPAKRYALVFWAHGMGYKDPALQHTKGFSPDTATSNYITTPQLGLIMKQAGAIDVLGFSSCLMQMAEVVYEMKDNVGVVVGSEEPLFGFGFDYSKFIRLLDANPSVSVEAAGDALAREYFAGVKKRGEWSQISVVRPAAMNGLLPKLDAWAAEAMAGKYEAAFDEARVWALRTGLRDPEQRYAAPYGDLYDFIANYSSKLGPRDAKMKQLSRDLLEYVSSQLVFKNYTEGFSFDYQQMNKAGGIAIHLPARNSMAFPGDKGMRVNYSDYAFSRDSKWDEFLKWAYPKR